MPNTALIEAAFQIVTPMYLGGEDQRATAIRPPSLKGALRFWWRALNWGRVLAEAQNNETNALRLLHAQEARLFGLAASDTSGGQGIFMLAVHGAKPRAEAFPLDNKPGSAYLRGQGLNNRTALLPGETFGVSLRFKPRCSEADTASVAQALYAFGLLGGLGSRARHGYGSVALRQWAGNALTVPTSRPQYADALKRLAIQLPEALPPFSAFSRHMRIDISLQGKDAMSLLEQVGGEQQLYRSFGKNGQVSGRPAEFNFKPDHDLVQAITRGQNCTDAPRRAVFGLPHNYLFSSTNPNAKAALNYAPGGSDARRASPLLLHIHPLGEGTECLAVHTLLAARFLPQGANIRAKSKGHGDQYLNMNPDWAAIHDYLDRPLFQDRETIHG